MRVTEIWRYPVKSMGGERLLDATLEGLSPAMLVALGEAGVLSLEDFADLAGDELSSAEDGILRTFDMGADDANRLIMSARVAAGWFSEEDLAQMEAERAAAEAEAAEEAAVEASGGAEMPV